MNAKKPTSEQRQSFRCTVAESRQQCAVRVGSEVTPAMLLDESAGGFSVLVDRSLGLHTGQTAELRTVAGWFEVRVVHVVQVPPPDGEAATSAERGPWFRLGLSRLDEVGQPDPPRVSVFAGSLYCHLSQWCPASGLFAVFFGILLALAIVSSPLYLVGKGWNVEPWKIGYFLPSQRSVSPSAGSRSNSSANGPTLEQVQSASVGSLAVESEKPSSQLPQNLRGTIRRLPGAAALEIPEVARALRLTGDQQERIQRVIEATTQAMRSLDAQLQGQQRQDISRWRSQLLDEARDEAFKVLTNRQREQWAKLAAGL